MKNRSRSDFGPPARPSPRQQRRAAASAAVPPGVTGLFGEALAMHQAGRLTEAEPLYRRVLEAHPRNFDSLHLLGVIHHQRGQYREAVRLIDAALAINPAVAAAHNNRGNALNELGETTQALASFERAIARKPDYAEAFYNRANVLRGLARLDEAVASYDRAIALRPDYADALSNRGSALKELERFDEALASFDRAVAVKPDYAEAWYNRANALTELKRFDEAVASCDRAIALRGDLAEAFNNRGNALKKLRRFDAAIESYGRALALKPDYADTASNRGSAFSELKQFEQALADYDRAIALAPDHVGAFNNRGYTLMEMRRLAEAVESFGRAMELDPDLDELRGAHLNARMHLCEWAGFDALCAGLNAAVERGAAAAQPFHVLACPSTPAVQLKCARNFVARKHPARANPIWRGERYGHARIRVAYLSPDLRDHPVGYLTAGLFARHDRARFETIAISFGKERPSEMRTRLKGSFDRFVDADAMSDDAVAAFIRELEIDIAVDLAGSTDGARPDVLAQRPAPVQVNYLGYAGTLGQDYCDYIVADRFVIPEAMQPHYAERVVYLPDSFMVNDCDRRISPDTPSRADVGLPDGFVFCCFNNAYKITPDLFDAWMRLLGGIDGSVLWLAGGNPAAQDNLRREAGRRGVDPDRLVFAAKTMLNEDHLARIRLADLFLDTLHYNAHATATDALWAGLPVLTCAGATFASRVAGSLLRAAGLPELVTASLAEYEALALRLARDRDLLASLRGRLARDRATCPLFDTARFTRHIEAAYTTMRERAERGEPPQGFAVAQGRAGE
jgi:predicted O-linked N-acetylglucosamine transferase (SPINDLY family)